jgi:hypothetical protein
MDAGELEISRSAADARDSSSDRRVRLFVATAAGQERAGKQAGDDGGYFHNAIGSVDRCCFAYFSKVMIWTAWLSNDVSVQNTGMFPLAQCWLFSIG